MASAPAWKQADASGPVVWWVRNDMRLEDNPVLRQAVGEALVDGRPLAAVLVFDPRFLDRSPYGRVTDPEFTKSIPTRKPIHFGNRKCCALRARFMLQCTRTLAEGLAARGAQLHVCHGRPEEVFSSLPQGSLVVCQQEPVSVECSDVEANVEAALSKKRGALRREWGAMSLYHKDDLPFRFEDHEMPNCFTELGFEDHEMPNCFTELGGTLGWDDIWSSPERSSQATPVRAPVSAPVTYPATPAGLQLPGLLPADVLADDSAALRRLGYSDEEIAEALGQEVAEGGEPHARALVEAWLTKQGLASGDNPQTAVFWDLPVGFGPGDGHDALQWANLAKPDGWMRVSHYLAVGCISAREIFARASECPNFNGVAHRLLWREWHRLNAIRYGRRLFWLQGPGWVERPWTSDAELAEAWKQGRTGVPYIDACMRELRKTGWLAYKGRKTAGFFLVFGLGVDWRIGAFHFEDTLLDYDCAMNYGNWVTVACVDKVKRATDAETVAQLVEAHREDIELKLSAEMANDPTGEYIRRWVPELQAVDAEYIHQPWTASEVPTGYPAPLTGPLRLSKDASDWERPGSTDVDDGQERRAHPKDRSGRRYTQQEFLDFADALGEPSEYGERLWAEAAPMTEGADDDKKQ